LPLAQGAEIDESAILNAGPQGAFVSSNDQETDYSQVALDDIASPGLATIKDIGEPIGPAFDRSGMTTYKVQSGDTLSKIASYFGISVGTIVSANPGVTAKQLRVGESLNILPTSGVVYQARNGDTIQTISDTFDISAAKITQFNPSVNFSILDPGTPIIIPGGNVNNLLAGSAALPNFDSDFIMPANGNDWGVLHHYNAVDIANSCGTPVVAAADGVVVPDDEIADVPGGWNGGYGNFVLIEHPFGNSIATRYAYLATTEVQVGDYVKQGQVIGTMGDTGAATGCEVHFEVIGAHNPFVKG
jgi:murein DD-endopeptidase MepM/ murein hydrolase activator NlpD